MSPNQIEKILKSYRANAARREHLQSELDEIKRGIQLEELPELHAVNAQSYEQRIAGGEKYSVVERLALSDRYKSDTIDSWRAQVADMNRELMDAERECKIVDIWLGGLTDRECIVIREHFIEGKTMREMTTAFQYPMSEQTIRRIKRAALDKIFEIAR